MASRWRSSWLRRASPRLALRRSPPARARGAPPPRLDARFRVLTGGRRTALPRHQTLRAALDWSYELLADAECVILHRLAVFAGSFSLEADSGATASAE